ncbi:MAG: fluoride efflux transporter CrcB [Aminipila sp.]
MINFLIVGAGGFIGASLRYGLGLVSKLCPLGTSYPIGTFLANIIGAFCIGMAFEFFSKMGSMGSSLQLFVMVGVLGGFTTFSSFSLETINLISEGKILIAATYAVASMIICFIGVFLGKLII